MFVVYMHACIVVAMHGSYDIIKTHDSESQGQEEPAHT